MPVARCTKLLSIGASRFSGFSAHFRVGIRHATYMIELEDVEQRVDPGKVLHGSSVSHAFPSESRECEAKLSMSIFEIYLTYFTIIRLYRYRIRSSKSGRARNAFQPRTPTDARVSLHNVTSDFYDHHHP